MFSDKEELNLDCTPIDEKCLQAGSDSEMQRLEAKAMLHQLTRQFGTAPYGCEIRINKNNHDAGMYLDLLFKYLPDTEAEEYVFKIEGDFPSNWDEEAREELTAGGYFKMEISKEGPEEQTPFQRQFSGSMN